MSEKQRVKEIIRPVSKLIEDDEYKLLLSELKSKANIDREGEPTPHLLNDNFFGLY
jgi:hypothetical protein